MWIPWTVPSTIPARLVAPSKGSTSGQQGWRLGAAPDRQPDEDEGDATPPLLRRLWIS
jgi:hypothetical protein